MLRKENGLSQEQLADILNISRQAISKWESGKAYPDIENLVQLRSIFKVTLDDLIINETLGEVKEIKDDTKVIEASIEDYEDYEDEHDFSSNLIIGGFIIGMAIGFITGNENWGIFGGLIGLGIGTIIETIIKRYKK
ncbi:helix-turn-helix domain-containing protein [Clostridium sardiniense]|uniref:Helix-turn-helix domain-containing protein n=1 Tax=Clostridium sardiniense TaxID=29369 RepID=A0ABS7L041_CLOSR|nr:helix-turn-helix domain-containing protein [Clostridium sardiniense]MDQ0459278.1 transcriptional regulator with XRE-family HTH domain [Clostridium sardiniense]